MITAPTFRTSDFRLLHRCLLMVCFLSLGLSAVYAQTDDELPPIEDTETFVKQTAPTIKSKIFQRLHELNSGKKNLTEGTLSYAQSERKILFYNAIQAHLNDKATLDEAIDRGATTAYAPVMLGQPAELRTAKGERLAAVDEAEKLLKN
jgi:hypothetical protein